MSCPWITSTAAAWPSRRNHDLQAAQPEIRMSRNVLLQLLGGTKSPAHLRRWVNFWPPFLGMGKAFRSRHHESQEGVIIDERWKCIPSILQR